MLRIYLTFSFISLFFNLQSQSAIYNFSNGLGLDASGNGNTGVLFGNSASGDSLDIGVNTTDYFQIPPSLLNNKVEFSIAFKVKFKGFNITGNSPTNHMFSGDLPAFEGSFATSYQKNVNSWYFVNGNSSYTFFDNNVLINQWYCVSLTRNANGLIKMYVDGIQNPTTYTNMLPLSMTNLILGQETDCFAGCFASNQSSNALFDYLNIYSTTLSTSDVSNICNNNNVSSRAELNDDNFIFQNPVSEILKIEHAESLQMIELFSIDGKRLFTKAHNQNEIMTVSMLEFKSGVYYLRLLSDKTILSFKLIKY
jgi:hypothetical protein